MVWFHKFIIDSIDLFYSDAAMRVSNEDWGGLTDILPFISKALWVYVIISILVNSITLLGDKK